MKRLSVFVLLVALVAGCQREASGRAFLRDINAVDPSRDVSARLNLVGDWCYLAVRDLPGRAPSVRGFVDVPLEWCREMAVEDASRQR